MELELGLKITKTRDDNTSISEYRLAKDRTGPIFQSRETSSMFILTAHLKGYKRNNIHIKINEDGSKISISGEKPIQEILMMGWIVFKKDVEITSFYKVFKIPDGVILDWIKAKYDEEECMLKIFMPKSIKGICGARIEEAKEEDSDRGKSKQERSEADCILNSLGETSKKGPKESQVQEMKDGESAMEKEQVLSEKMIDDANVDWIKDTIKTEIEESNLGIKDGGGTSVREKVGKVEHEALKTSDLEQNVGTSIPHNTVDTSHDKESENPQMEGTDGFQEKNEGRVLHKIINDVNGGTTGEKKHKANEVGNGASVREKGGTAEYEAKKTTEIEQKVVAAIPQSIADTSHEKEPEVQEMSDKKLDDSKGDIIGAVIEKEIEEFKLGIEGGDGAIKLEQNIEDHIPQSIGDTSQELSKESVVQQMQEADSAVVKVLEKANGFSKEDASGVSKQKEFEQPKSQIEDIHKESFEQVSMERSKDTKTSELDQDDVAYHIPRTVNGDEECQKEKAEKEAFEAIATVREEFPRQLPKATQEVSIGQDVAQMKERQDATESMVKRKGKEIECSVEKGEGEEPKGMHVHTRPHTENNITEEKRQEEIEKPKSAIKGSDQKGGFEVLDSIITEELPKQIREKLPDGSKGFKDEKIQDPKEFREAESSMEKVEGETIASRASMKSTETLQKEDERTDIERRAKEGPPDIIVKGAFDVTGTMQVKVPNKVVEAMTLDENDRTECSTLTLKGEGSIRMNLEANKISEEDITRDRTEKEIRAPKLNSRDQLRVEENIDNGGVDGSQRQDLPEVRETEDDRGKGTKTEQAVKEVNREKHEEIQVEANGGFREDATWETSQKENPIQTKEKDRSLHKKMDKEKTGEASMAAKEESPMKMVDLIANRRKRLEDTRIEEAKEGRIQLVKKKGDEKVGETEDIKDDAETEQYEKVEEAGYKMIQVETNGGKRKEITRETTQKETKDPEIQTKEKDQQCWKDEMSKERPEVSKAVQEEFPVNRIDSLANEKEKQRDTMPEKANEVQEELVKQNIEEHMEEAEDVKDKGAETEKSVKKEKGDKYEKLQVEASHGGLRKDITRETTHKETKEPKIQTEDKDQQCLQDAMSEGRYEASTTARELPSKIIDSPAKRRDEPKDKKKEEAEKVEEEVSKRKAKETEVAGSTTKENFQETTGKRIIKTLQEVPKEGHPEALDIELNERDLQPENCPTTHAKAVRLGNEEVKQGRAKKQKTKLLSPTIQSKETLESRNESVDQDIVKSKKAKDAEKGEQCTKAVATIEDQVARTRFPSTQQFEVGESKLQEGCKEKYEPSPESQKEYHEKDLQDSIEMKDQGSLNMEVLRPEVQLEELLKKSEQENKKDEPQKGQEVEEIVQELIEQPNDKVDDGDQQYVQPGVGEDVGTVEVLQREMPKEEYASNAAPTAGRMETKRNLEKTPEIEKDMTENVSDVRLRKKQEIKRTDFEKEHQRKSKKEAVPLEAISSLPEPHHKDLPPLTQTAETKSKEPPQLEQSIAEWKLPQTKEYVPESRDRKQYGYGTEPNKATKRITDKGAKPSEDEENRKSENATKENNDKEFHKSIEWVAPTENEYVETLEACLLENQGLGEKHEDYGQEAAPGECDYKVTNKEGSNSPEISIGDRGQQYVQQDNDKKGYKATKAVNEEMLSRQHRAEQTVLEEREVPKVVKSEEPKDSSRQLHKRKKGKTTQIAEDKMPETDEMTPEFEKANGFKQGAERIQEPATTIEITPKKGMEKSHKEEMSLMPTEIQRKDPYELSWSSMATQKYHVKEDKMEGSDEVGNQESSKEDTNTNVHYSNKSEPDQEIEHAKIPQPKSCKDELCINKEEEESQGKHEAVGEKARKLQEEDECEVVIVGKEEASGGIKNKKTRTKKLLFPLVIGSTLLVSLVSIFVHRNRARKR